MLTLMAFAGPSNGRIWGRDATLLPGWRTAGEAAVDALLAPATWLPAAGAAVMQIGSWDADVSRWASEHTPVFGSRQNAERAGDFLRGAAGAAYLVTALAAPGDEQLGDWTVSKLQGITVGAAALATTGAATEILKDRVKRSRPDDSNRHSFPSGHASTAAALTTLSSRNVCFLLPEGRSHAALNLGLGALAAGTGWARMEAEKHFASDVLLGLALGHFCAAWINDAFLGLDPAAGIGVSLETAREKIMVGLKMQF